METVALSDQFSGVCLDVRSQRTPIDAPNNIERSIEANQAKEM